MGISISEYNEMTPYELSMAIRIFNEKQHQEIERKQHEIEEQLTVAFLGAYWQRVEKLSNQHLKDVLKKLHEGPQPKQMTPEQMLEEVKRLNAAFGGTIY